MQSVSSRIWTLVAVSISYNDNDYTTGTSYVNVGNFTKWRVKPDYSSISIFSSYIWGIIIVSPILTSAQVPLLFLLPLEPEFTGITYSSLPWNRLFLRASSCILLISLKILLHEDSLLILLFTELGICFNNDLGWLELIFM